MKIFQIIKNGKFFISASTGSGYKIPEKKVSKGMLLNAQSDMHILLKPEMGSAHATYTGEKMHPTDARARKFPINSGAKVI